MNGRNQIFVGRAIALTVALIASPVAAHPGHEAMGVGAGLIHPLTGIDHFMAMIAIGLLAAKQRTAPVWSLPLAFVVMMMIGMMAGSATGSGTGTEITIAACLVLAGLALMTGRDMPLLPGAVLAAVSGFAHGMAHAIDNAGSLCSAHWR
jgi:urease accessory protein